MTNESEIKKALIEEIKAFSSEFPITRNSNSMGYAQALCWVLGKDKLGDLLEFKYNKFLLKYEK